MKKTACSLIIFLFAIYSHGQAPQPDKKYSPQQLKLDLSFLIQQLFDAHANPYTELSKAQYEALFDSISSKITDSADVCTFYKLIKPTFAYLSDEHSAISIDTPQFNSTYKNEPVFLPFTLIQLRGVYVVDKVLTANTGLNKGDVIMEVDHQPIATVVKKCALYTTGFPGQRVATALARFGYLYSWANAGTKHQFVIRTSKNNITVAGTDLKIWLSYLNPATIIVPASAPMISYTRFNNAGYINCSSFLTHNDKEFDSLQKRIDTIFRQVKADGIKTLFIDVSKNSGGNSSVGDVLINYIYAKPYLSYQCNWRRSDEYLKLIKSWGINNYAYIQQPVGSVLHYDAEQITPPADNPDRFSGKVYVIIGDGTFSSAMMFATIIKDDHIATLIGQTPQNGHPDHFGELYNAELPNTKLKFRFGVKEWIRPAGKLSDNYLRPDVVIEPGKYVGMGELIEAVDK